MTPSILDFSNDETLTKLKQQDHGVFKVLVETHHSLLVAVAKAIVGESIAEEVVQESWLSAFRSLPKFEQRSSIKTWLYTIVSNCAKTRLRKESKTTSLSPEDQAQDPLDRYQFDDKGHWDSSIPSWHLDTPDRLLEQEQLRCCINKTLTLLPDQQRAVFYLRDVEQQSLGDICNILGLSDSNTRVLLHRARVKLMQVIAHYQETGTC